VPTSDSIEVELDETPVDESEDAEVKGRTRRWPRVLAATFAFLAVLGGLGALTYELAPAETTAVMRQVLERAAALTR